LVVILYWLFIWLFICIIYIYIYILLDEELPEYVMVMIGNNRSHAQMASELKVFLGSSTVDFTDWLQMKLAQLRSNTNESDSREGTPLLDEKAAVKLPTSPVVVDARDVIRSKREGRDEDPKPKIAIISSVVTAHTRSRPKPNGAPVRNTSLLTRAIADATKSTQNPPPKSTTRIAIKSAKPETQDKEVSRIVGDKDNGFSVRRPVHERLGHRVGTISRPDIEDISSDEEKQPALKKLKEESNDRPDSPKFIVTLDGAEGMFDFDQDHNLPTDSDDDSPVSKTSVFSRIGGIISPQTTVNPFEYGISPTWAPKPRFPQQMRNQPSFQAPQPAYWPTAPFRPRLPSQHHRPGIRPPSQYKLVKNQFPSRDKLKWTASKANPSGATSKSDSDKGKTVTVVTH
jgi:hypothetical protein